MIFGQRWGIGFSRNALIGDIVDAAAAPGVAAGDPTGRQPAALDPAVLLQGFQRIGAAGWMVAAVKADPRAEDQPICPDGQGQDAGERAHLRVPCRMSKACWKSFWSWANGSAAVAFLRPIST